MFGRHKDFHGSRRYALDDGAPSMVAWLRFQVEKFLRAGAPPDTTTWLIRDGEKHFTTLGIRPAEAKRRPHISDIFPIPEEERRGA